MDTPPYSDVSAQFSPNSHPNHVGPDTHPLPGPSALAHPHPHNGHSASASGSGSASADLRALYSSSLSALDITPPPTLREILSAYKQKGDGDRDMLLAMLNAKTAEDQRIASQLTLRRTILDVNNQTSEPHHRPYSYPQLTHSRSAHARGHYPYTYQPEEPYASHYYHSGHHAEAASPPAPSHSYPHRYAPPHSRAPPPPQAHISAAESPSLSSVTQKASVLSTATRTRASARPSSRGELRASDARAQAVYAAPPQFQTFRKKRQRSRSPSPVGSYRSYTYVRSPYTRPLSAGGDPDRDAYTSPSESGTPPNAYGPGHPRAMAIGSLLSAKTAGASANGTASTSRTNGPNRPPSVTKTNGSATTTVPPPPPASAGGRLKEDRPEQEDELEEEEEKQAWHRERERVRRESREER